MPFFKYIRARGKSQTFAFKAFFNGLGVIGASVGMVSALYGALWLADLRKKRKVRVMKPAFSREAEAFGGEIAAAAQPAK
jgi:hypothetical protein